MDNRPQKDEGKRVEIGGSKSINMKKRKYQKPKHMSDPNFYNPATIKKQREFYKNAKYVSKFKRSVKREGQQIESKGVDGSENTSGVNKSRDNKAKYSLGEIYKKKNEELEKERKEREAIMKAKNEERQAKEARRKADKAKRLKKTRYGQPIMKYKIERLLESIQGSRSSG